MERRINVFGNTKIKKAKSKVVPFIGLEEALECGYQYPHILCLWQEKEIGWLALSSGRLYPMKVLVLILKEAEIASKPIRTR